jgi:hypothetical protein
MAQSDSTVTTPSTDSRRKVFAARESAGRRGEGNGHRPASQRGVALRGHAELCLYPQHHYSAGLASRPARCGRSAASNDCKARTNAQARYGFRAGIVSEASAKNARCSSVEIKNDCLDRARAQYGCLGRDNPPASARTTDLRATAIVASYCGYRSRGRSGTR